MKRYLIFDTETNGLPSNRLLPLDRQPRCTELFGLLCDEYGNELEVFSSLFNTGEKQSEEVIKITGITDAMLAEAPTFNSLLVPIDDFFNKADYIVGHNVTFDIDIITNEFRRSGEEWVRESKPICTVEETEYIKGFRMNLTGLHDYLFGLPFDGAHRAESDVRATKKCFFELKKRELI